MKEFIEMILFFDAANIVKIDLTCKLSMVLQNKIDFFRVNFRVKNTKFLLMI